MKVIDAFMFFNELELLEMRLHELSPIVDHFVIVESLERHGSSKPKAALLRDNWSVLKGFEDRVKYVLLKTLEPAFRGEDGTARRRENFNRNALLQPILDVSTSPEDVVLLSDCDEIPRMAVVRDNLLAIDGIRRLSQAMYYHNVNRFYGEWDWATVGTVRSMQAIGGPQAMRFAARPNGKTDRTLSDAGWHFSYFGDAARVRNKIESFMHSTDPDCQSILRRDDHELAKEINTGIDIYHRVDRNPKWREIDDPSLPAHFLNNIARYKNLTAGGKA